MNKEALMKKLGDYHVETFADGSAMLHCWHGDDKYSYAVFRVDRNKFGVALYWDEGSLDIDDEEFYSVPELVAAEKRLQSLELDGHKDEE